MIPLDGIRVLEVAMWGFVPSASVVLADWGADVIKVEHPTHGDPMRGLVTGGQHPAAGRVNFMWEIMNRGKRGITIDLRSPQGREVILNLATSCDVFITSFLPEARAALGIDEGDVKAVNPSIVYAIGSGMGRSGPEANRGGYDMAAFWSRAGTADNVTPDESPYPVPMPAAAFGDVTSGALLAGGIAAALLGRQRTGEGTTVDLSLFASGMWSMSTEITGVRVLDAPAYFRPTRANTQNPLVTSYATSDGRYVQLIMLEADRHWPDLCERIGRADLISDERFLDAARRADNSGECMTELQKTFASYDLEYWKHHLAGATGVWAVVAKAAEVVDDPQALANSYVREAQDLSGVSYPLVPSPVRFDGELCSTAPAPEHGQHTELILLEAGIDWDGISALRDGGVI